MSKTTAPWTAAYIREDYEPHFDRSGTTRRVLAHVTDDDHVGRGPRNTPERLAQELAEDRYTRIGRFMGMGATEWTEIHPPEAVPGVVADHLEKLVNAGLIEQREDGTYGVTEAGLVELVN